MIIVSAKLFIISDVLGTYYGICTLSWLMTKLSRHCDDSILYKKIGRHRFSILCRIFVA
jgi:hypothetical protein